MSYVVGIKCGMFNLMSGGHIACLRECRFASNYLICLTQTDDIIEKLKGSPPPICLHERLMILESIRFVDEVGVYSEKTEDKWLRNFKKTQMPIRFPDAKLVLFHSEELKGRKNLPGQDIVDEIIFVPRKYQSTSQIIDGMIQNTKQWKDKKYG